MAGCQSLSLSMLATHGYNSILHAYEILWNNTKKNNYKKHATVSAKYKVQQDNVHTI